MVCPMAPSPRPVPRLDSVSRIYEALRGLIVRGQLSPGTRIAERVVAERLGSSRTPVRTALHRLQQEGFVASAGRGRDQRLIVAPVTRQDGEEVFTIVGHLEGLAARTAATLPTPRRKVIAREMRELNRRLVAESRRAAGGDVSRAFELDQALHATYVDGVAGPRLLALHRAIRPQTERYARIYISVLMRELATSVREHETIARAIAAGDRVAAQRAAETNWHNAATRLATVIGEHGERGNWHAVDAEPDGTRRSVR